MAKEKEDKVVLERVYVVPLRRKCAHTPMYKRTPKAIKVLRIFLAKHMKASEENIKLDVYINHEMWARGIRKPLPKVKVKAKKYESGKVLVELAEVPAFLKFKIEKDKKMHIKTAPVEEKKEEKTEEEKKVQEEKTDSVVEAGLQQQKQAAKEMKHQVQTQHQIKKPLARKTLQK